MIEGIQVKFIESEKDIEQVAKLMIIYVDEYIKRNPDSVGIVPLTYEKARFTTCYYKDRNAEIWLAKAIEDPAGFAIGSHKKEEARFETMTYESNIIYTHPKYRGRGLGPYFTKLMIESAKKQGMVHLEARIHSDNDESVSIHKKLGFTLREEGHISEDGIGIVDYVATLKL